MSEKNLNGTNDAAEQAEQAEATKMTNVQMGNVSMAEESPEGGTLSDELTVLQAAYDELNKSHLYLKADFENYRKRTLQEKAVLIKTGGESALMALLPVVDDFERALSTIKGAQDATAIQEGVELIYSKFMAYLTAQGVKPIEAVGQPFDTEFFDAITMIPAPAEELKGKVVDCVQTGYTLYDKVIRHSKVVVGE